MRVTVDRDLCEANGVCANLVPAEQADLVRRAVLSCPKVALRLED